MMFVYIWLFGAILGTKAVVASAKASYNKKATDILLVPAILLLIAMIVTPCRTCSNLSMFLPLSLLLNGAAFAMGSACIVWSVNRRVTYSFVLISLISAMLVASEVSISAR